MTEPTTRIMVAIDIPGTPEEAYRELLRGLRAAHFPEGQSWGWETTDEWYHDGVELDEVTIHRITQQDY